MRVCVSWSFLMYFVSGPFRIISSYNMLGVCVGWTHLLLVLRKENAIMP